METHVSKGNLTQVAAVYLEPDHPNGQRLSMARADFLNEFVVKPTASVRQTNCFGPTRRSFEKLNDPSKTFSFAESNK